MLASGTWLVNVLFTGSTTSELGAMPNVHIIEAPIQTCIAIHHLLPIIVAYFSEIRFNPPL